MADHRYAMRSADIVAIAGRLAADLFVNRGFLLPRGLEQLASVFEKFKVESGDDSWILTAADDLVNNRGQSVIAVGPRQPAELHALAHVLNTVLRNANRTVSYTPEPDPLRTSDSEAIQGLAESMRAGQVNTLVILGGNPVYNAPADVEFAGALAGVETSIHLSAYDDETSRLCRWHLPRAHYLESWSDGRAYDGTISVAQPLIEPLYGGMSALELLAVLVGESPARGYDLVRRTIQKILNVSDFETAWRRLLHDGILADSAPSTVSPNLEPASLNRGLSGLTPKSPEDENTLEVVFVQDAGLYDGRFANNGWLQEAPDPLTKLTWDNAALLSPATAERLSVAHGDVVTLEHQGRALDAPVMIMPGQAPHSIALALGYGRRACGAVGDGVGVDTYSLRTTTAMHLASGVRIAKTGRTYQLATTQDHHAIDTVGIHERESRIGRLIREANLDYYRYHPDFITHDQHGPPLVSLWEEHTFEGHQWAMAIDLSLCIGCGACVVACQAENNIPIVGKENVAEGREMHWMRVDRYFAGDPERPRIVHQPVACHHCELAPCEQVCPVAATVHDDEGLNAMVYNRCVGTRYCSNNCPYKVRRFNFFNYHRKMSDVQKMAHNPDVTVRSRGVMEKCTFCIQRIKAVTIPAKNDRRPLADGEIIPACAQTCPTRAIVFGDLADPDSRVRKLHEHNRAYAILGELNIKPRTKYLARLHNRIPEPENKPEGTHQA
jgi:Fe-S-cluster-containing dehydrogenase component